MSVNYDSIMDDFINESRELLDRAETAILTLEQGGFQQDLVNDVFRAVHTIKGNSGLFELTRISGLSHALENLLNLMRNREIPVAMDSIDVILTCLDRLREMIQNVSRSNEYNIEELLTSISSIVEKNAPGREAAKEGAPPPPTEAKKSARETPPPREETKVVPAAAGESASVSGSSFHEHEPFQLKIPARYLKLAKEKNRYLSLVYLDLNEQKVETLSHITEEIDRLQGSEELLMHGLREDRIRSLTEAEETSIPYYLLLATDEPVEEFLKKHNYYSGMVRLIFHPRTNGHKPVKEGELVATRSEVKSAAEASSAAASPSETGAAMKEAETMVELSFQEESASTGAAVSASPEATVGSGASDTSAVSGVSGGAREEVVSLPGGEFIRTSGRRSGSPGGGAGGEESGNGTGTLSGGAPAGGGGERAGGSAAAEGGNGSAGKSEERGDTHLRVPIKLIDSLINLAGETVIARNELLQRIGGLTDATLEASGKRISYLITRLQEGIMRTRLQELNTVFQKLPRIVRDAATSTGKRVELVVEGGEVELDKTLIEAIGDSIMHMIRNSVDHGLEPPEERVRLGKPEAGLVKVKAQLRGGNVILTIQDDGRGLNLEKIRSSAVMRGLVPKEAASRLTADEIGDLIFLPGLSTATEVTKTSGRGVGMDVVRSNFKRVGGNVEIASEPGHGTTFTGTLPQTLTIVTCLMVKSRGVLFALPQQNVMELILLDRDQVSEVEGHDVYSLRGHLLPLLNLGNVLGLSIPEEGEEPSTVEEALEGAADLESRRQSGEKEESGESSPGGAEGKSSDASGSSGSSDASGASGGKESEAKSRSHFVGISESMMSGGGGILRGSMEGNLGRISESVRDGTYIVVVRSERHHFGLVIDEIVNLEEIVVKRLGEHFAELSFFSGAAIMGDGESVLILDVPGMAKFTNLQANLLEEEEGERVYHEERLLQTGYLLFRVYGQQFGVKVDTIPRIERILAEEIGVFMGVEIIQYREEIVPVVRLEELYDFETRKVTEEGDELYVVIFTIDGMKSGLVVTEIENVVDELPEVDHRRFGGNSIEGHTILKGEITLVLDAVDLLMRLQNSRFKEIMRQARERQKHGQPLFEKREKSGADTRKESGQESLREIVQGRESESSAGGKVSLKGGMESLRKDLENQSGQND